MLALLNFVSCSFIEKEHDLSLEAYKQSVVSTVEKGKIYFTLFKKYVEPHDLSNFPKQIVLSNYSFDTIASPLAGYIKYKISVLESEVLEREDAFFLAIAYINDLFLVLRPCDLATMFVNLCDIYSLCEIEVLQSPAFKGWNTEEEKNETAEEATPNGKREERKKEKSEFVVQTTKKIKENIVRNVLLYNDSGVEEFLDKISLLNAHRNFFFEILEEILGLKKDYFADGVSKEILITKENVSMLNAINLLAPEMSIQCKNVHFTRKLINVVLSSNKKNWQFNECTFEVELDKNKKPVLSSLCANFVNVVRCKDFENVFETHEVLVFVDSMKNAEHANYVFKILKNKKNIGCWKYEERTVMNMIRLFQFTSKIENCKFGLSVSVKESPAMKSHMLAKILSQNKFFVVKYTSIDNVPIVVSSNDLEYISNLRFISYMGDGCVKFCYLNRPVLQNLVVLSHSIKGCTDEDVKLIAENGKRLRVLELYRSTLSKSSLELICENLTSIFYLGFEYACEDADNFSVLNKLSDLRMLSVKFETAPSDEFLVRFSSLVNAIKTLNYSAFMVRKTENAQAILKKIKSLKHQYVSTDGDMYNFIVGLKAINLNLMRYSEFISSVEEEVQTLVEMVDVCTFSSFIGTVLSIENLEDYVCVIASRKRLSVFNST